MGWLRLSLFIGAIGVLGVPTLGACDEADRRVTTAISLAHPSSVAGPSVTPQPADPVVPGDPAPGDPDPSEPDPSEPDPNEPVIPDPTDPTSGDPTDPANPEVPPGPLACPAGVSCFEGFPYFDSGDTALGASNLDRYACAPDKNEGGPERVYRVILPEPGLIVARLDGLPSGVDVDVHVLAGGDSPAAASCLDRGHWDSAAMAPAGAVWIVVDSWVNANGKALSGAYTLGVSFVAASDFEDQGLDESVLSAALHVFAEAWKARDTTRFEYTVIDFSLHSIHPRLWTIDLAEGELLFAQRVSHGEGSADAGDTGWAVAFSNVEGSHKSSLGLMRTGARYMSSSNGLSLRLNGLERGLNDQVYARAIVIHSDSYAADSYAERNGRMGLSWGCQVIDPARISDFVDTVEGGSLVWSYYPDPSLEASSYLDGWTAP